jgi:hypothetical protein
MTDTTALPSSDTPIGWLPDTTIAAWIEANADEFHPHASVTVSNGNIITVLKHEHGRTTESALNRGFDVYMKKPTGQYWRKEGSDRLCDVLVYIVARPRKAPDANPFSRKIDGSRK